MEQLIEQWKDIPNYEGLYQASNMGRIRTCEGKITSSARFKKRVWKQRVLKQKKQARRSGRLDCRVSLWKDGNVKTWLVARLIAMTWCKGYMPEMTVNHINCDTADNRACNLEWVTHKENILLGFQNGLYPQAKTGKRYI